MLCKAIVKGLLTMAIVACAVAAQAATIETVLVGDPGNASELSGKGAPSGTGDDWYCGSVAYTYRIGKYEVNARQYGEFLNAVGSVDTYALYNTNMASTVNGCGIARTGGGTVGDPYSYMVDTNFVDRPVNFVGYGDAMRFANWLHNGQPTGAQDTSTTEDGAYFVNGATDNFSLWITIFRESDWKWAVTSEDEWYKAAYYKGGGTDAGYWDYPTCSDTAPGRDRADVSGNNANYSNDNATDYPIEPGMYRTVGGDFQDSESPYGTFDQGGNVWEWNEAILPNTTRGLRGGSFYWSSNYLLASRRGSYYGFPLLENHEVGFRVSNAVAPVPGDANNDGVVDDADATILASHWHQTGGANWVDGDFNDDDIVDDRDASILAAHWTGSPSEGHAEVPEPTTLAMLAGAVMSLWFLRRR